ncbi:hypothetical protein [Asticcacaulis sp. AC402]|uniref:hypothetical protein n=1 Tax=Asticcacaulis sp. AC402 TaxID=1282361 RepID=UPI0003C3FAC1|nr:hypothetical protein [Asticcacaulis sp. AC402]ESQ76284.1 hypothetical protein ABAC402_05265 [Asticcacaulis sp. AC402]
MHIKSAALFVKLSCVVALAACLSGCLIVVDGRDDDFHHDAPTKDEKPAETGSF